LIPTEKRTGNTRCAETVEKLPPDAKRTRLQGEKGLEKGAEPSFPFVIGIQFVKKQSFFDKRMHRAFPVRFLTL